MYANAVLCIYPAHQLDSRRHANERVHPLYCKRLNDKRSYFQYSNISSMAEYSLGSASLIANLAHHSGQVSIFCKTPPFSLNHSSVDRSVGLRDQPVHVSVAWRTMHGR